MERDAGVAGGRSGSGTGSLATSGIVSRFLIRTGSGLVALVDLVGSFVAVLASLSVFSVRDSGQDLRGGSGLRVARDGKVCGKGGGAIGWAALAGSEGDGIFVGRFVNCARV